MSGEGPGGSFCWPQTLRQHHPSTGEGISDAVALAPIGMVVIRRRPQRSPALAEAFHLFSASCSSPAVSFFFGSAPRRSSWMALRIMAADAGD